MNGLDEFISHFREIIWHAKSLQGDVLLIVLALPLVIAMLRWLVPLLPGLCEKLIAIVLEIFEEVILFLFRATSVIFEAILWLLFRAIPKALLMLGSYLLRAMTKLGKETWTLSVETRSILREYSRQSRGTKLLVIIHFIFTSKENREIFEQIAANGIEEYLATTTRYAAFRVVAQYCWATLVALAMRSPRILHSLIFGKGKKKVE